MRTFISAVVTLDDLKAYVQKKGVEVREREDGLEVSSRSYVFDFKPKNPKFRVRIEATDDPSDSEEDVTAEPVKFIAKFLGGGIPGGEHFEKMSSGPDILARILRHVAAGVDAGNIGPKRAAAALRRAAVLPDSGLLERIVLAVCQTAAGQEISEKEISKLQAEMKKKGWKVEESRGEAGLPELKVDVSGIYEATVSVDAIPYVYEFSVVGHPDLDEKGETEDPIAQIRKFVKSDSVQAAVSRREVETGETEAAPAGVQTTLRSGPTEEKTVAPKKKEVGPSEEKTVAPKKKE